MKISVIGASHGVPEKNRSFSTTLITVNGSHYLIDAGAPIAEYFVNKELDVNKLKAVFLTHHHSDHTLGILHLMSLCSWYYSESSFDSYFPDEMSKGIFTDFIAKLLEHEWHPDRIRTHSYEPGVIFEDENIKVTAIPTEHMAKVGYPSYAFAIEGEGKRVVFTGDLAHNDPVDFPRLAETEKCDLIISELAHFHTDKILPHMEKCDTKLWCFNHYNSTWGQEELKELIAHNSLPYPVRILTDGDEVEI